MTQKHDEPADGADETATGSMDSQMADVVAPGNNETDALRDQYLRLAADFENYKRRRILETEERSRYASADAALAILPVLDNLRRSLEHAPDDADDTVQNFVNGIGLVVRDFESALERLGVTVIDAVGEPFDPAVHEAIGGEESPDVECDTVIAEFQRGYRLHDRVLRPAMVRVAHPAHPAKA